MVVQVAVVPVRQVAQVVEQAWEEEQVVDICEYQQCDIAPSLKGITIHP